MRKAKITTTAIVVAFLLIGLMTGCAGKARTLRVAAAQFKAESISAVNAIDEMRKKESAAPEKTPAEAAAVFENNALNSNSTVTLERIKLWEDPDAVGLNPETEKAWSEFIAEMRMQYTTFSGIFDEIQQASFFGRKIVKRGAPHVENLTAQLIYFAKSIQRNPPIFLQRRAALMAELQTIKDSGADEIDKRRELSAWRDRWLALGEEERAMEQKTAAQCLKAALIGKEIQNQILNYDKLSMNDITEGLAAVIGVAGAVTGRDLSHVQSQVDGVVAEIDKDPVWKEASALALGEMNKAIVARETSP